MTAKVQWSRIWKFTRELLSHLPYVICSNELWRAWFPDRADSLTALLLYELCTSFPFTFHLWMEYERRLCASFYLRTALFFQREHSKVRWIFLFLCYMIGCIAWNIVKLYKRWEASVVRLFDFKTLCNTDQKNISIRKKNVQVYCKCQRLSEVICELRIQNNFKLCN